MFSRIANVPTEGVPYPVFAFAALVPWTMFSSSVASSSASLVGNQNLVSRSTSTRLVIPAGAVFAWIPDFVIGSAFLFVIMAIFRLRRPHRRAAAHRDGVDDDRGVQRRGLAFGPERRLPRRAVRGAVLDPGVALHHAGRVPDVLGPRRFRWITGLNPATWAIDFGRWALTGTSSPWPVVGLSIATTIVLLVRRPVLLPTR